jgi:hypothetical protein
VQRHLSHDILLCVLLKLKLLVLVPLQILRHVNRLHKHIIVVAVGIKLWNARRSASIRVAAPVVVIMSSAAAAMISTTSPAGMRL